MIPLGPEEEEFLEGKCLCRGGAADGRDSFLYPHPPPPEVSEGEKKE